MHGIFDFTDADADVTAFTLLLSTCVRNKFDIFMCNSTDHRVYLFHCLLPWLIARSTFVTFTKRINWVYYITLCMLIVGFDTTRPTSNHKLWRPLIKYIYDASTISFVLPLPPYYFIHLRIYLIDAQLFWAEAVRKTRVNGSMVMLLLLLFFHPSRLHVDHQRRRRRTCARCAEKWRK